MGREFMTVRLSARLLFQAAARRGIGRSFYFCGKNNVGAFTIRGESAGLLIVQDNTEERIIYMDLSVVIDEA
jgi:hypothetical protein